MTLPGKYCIGILEEDNPLRSYFCFKPLLVEENGRYVPFSDDKAYPERGCIRIVPDKNESNHFKTRMRHIGLFAAVDLRNYQAENAKIRINKNYSGDGTELHAWIIYSDVIREPAPGSIFSVVSMPAEEAENSILQEPPVTSRIVLRREDGTLQPGIWRCEQDDGQSEVLRLVPAEEDTDVGSLQCFTLPGFNSELCFAIAPPQPLPDKQTAVPAGSEESVAPVGAPGSSGAVPSTGTVSAEAPAASLRPAPPEIPQSRRFRPDLASQSGLNPRRGRTLQEIVDEKWRFSRMDQLGHTVPGLETDAPVSSPSETAIDALREAWSRRDLRPDLVAAINELEGAEAAIAARRRTQQENEVNDHLTELEAERLKMLDELEELRHNSVEIREQLKKEIRRDEADAFAEAVRKTEQARNDQAKAEEEASRSRAAAESAQDALDAMSDGRFEQRLSDFVINSRAAQWLRSSQNADAPEDDIPYVEADDQEIIARLRGCIADAGLLLSATEAIDLLICLTQSPVLLLSGPSGSGKTAYARMLAQSLGLFDCDRFESIGPNRQKLVGNRRIDRLRKGHTTGMLLLDDANLAKDRDPMRGIRRNPDGSMLLIATIQDTGYPLPSWLVSRSFLLRLADEAPDSAWQPRIRSTAKTYAPVSWDSIRKAFGPRTISMPAAASDRLSKLRRDLATCGILLSRGTLNALWSYCSAAIPLMPLEPSAVLDLALAHRAIPGILATAPLDALRTLPRLLSDLPHCKALFEQPLPIEI